MANARQRKQRCADKANTSIEKALAVLNAFDRPRMSRGIADLQRELDIPRPTLHRILKQLEQQGFVRQLPSKRYQIGLRMFELGSLISDHMMLRIPAIPHMHALYHQTGYSVYLSVWADDELLHLDCLPSKFEPPLPTQTGGRWGVHCASLGKVLLAYAPDEDLQRYISRPLKPNTRYTITDRNELLEHLREVRRVGYATTIEESILGVFGVAAPIWGQSQRVIGAICIAGRNRALLRKYSEVIATANAISRDVVKRVLSD